MMGRFRCLGTRGRSAARRKPSGCPFTLQGPSSKTSIYGTSRGLDILIGPKEVRRVIARLDSREPWIVRSVGLAHPVLSFHAKPVDVHGAFGEGTHRLEELPRPRDMALGIRWIGPLREDEEVVVDVAMRERRRGRVNPGRGAMHVLQPDGGAAGPSRAADGCRGGPLSCEVQHDVD